VEGSTRYDLWVDDLTTGQSQVLRNQQVTGTSFTPTVPLAVDHSYRVYVSAANSYGLGPWSAPKDFGIGNAPIEPPTGIPSLTAPVGTGNTVTPTFQWTAVAGANRFDLWVDDLTTGQSQILREQAITGGTSFTPTTPLPNNHAYKAWIRAGNEFGFGGWSAAQDFGVGNVPIQPPADTPIISAPTGTGNSVTPLFQWNAVQDATRFDLWVDDITAGTSQVIRQQALSTNSFTPATPMTNDHAYRAWVRAGNDFGFGSWSAPKEFGVGNVPIAPPAGVPTVTAPTGTVTTLTPIFQWSAVQDATKYDLWIDSLTTGASQVIRQQGLVATSFTPVLPLTNEHSYRIWVRAGNDFGFGPWSAQQDFTIAVPANQAPVVNAGADITIQLPNQAALNGTATDDNLPDPPAAMTFAWSKVSGPGAVTFGTVNALQTSATFSQAGAYVLRLAASDSVLSSSDDITVTVEAPAGVANDNFANAILLTGAFPLVATSSNVEATIETNEPNHAGSAPEKTLWWKWTAPTTGPVSISTMGSNFNTTLAVYTGNALSTLSLVAENDDSSGFYPYPSRVVFDGVEGVTYQIVVGGIYSESGSIRLEIGPQSPVNDNFANATPISGNSITLVATNEGATREESEPAHAGFDGNHSVWWKWVAPESARYEIELQTENFSTLLGVYVGPSVDALTTVNSVFDKFISFDAVAGTEYHIALDGATYYGTSIGIVTFNLRQYISPLISIEATDAESSEDGRNEGLITIRRLNSTSGQIPVTISFSGSASYGIDFEELSGEQQPITLYLYDEMITIPIRARDDADIEGAETIQVQLDPSTAYTVSGNPQAQITIQDVAPPTNDQFANATTLNVGVNSSHNVGATIEPNEPGSGESTRSVWWKWTATKNGPVAVNVVTDFSISAAVYSGVSIDQLALDKLIFGPTSFIAVQGQEYRIRVAGSGSTYGDIQVVFTLDDPNPVQAAISYPIASSTVSGSLSVIGQAIDADGGTFQLEYFNQQEFNYATGVVATGSLSIQNGELGIWNTNLLPPGIYELKLTARDVFGFTAEIVRTVNIGTSVAASTAKSSPLSTASPFDEAQFLNNTDWRTEYLATLEPSRVWQSAVPGAGVIQLKSQGSTRKVSAAGSTVTLTVVGAPNWPVTFCCMNKGRFVQNMRNVITVVADAQGVATVTAEVEKGRNTVLAASPKSSGQIVFLLQDQ